MDGWMDGVGWVVGLGWEGGHVEGGMGGWGNMWVNG